MVLVPCEWAACGPIILVWNWCWYETSAGGPVVLVWNSSSMWTSLNFGLLICE